MKTTIVRAFVLTLAIAGFGAATVASHARTNANNTMKASVVPLSVVGSSPTVCAPSDPSHCGLD